MRVVVVGGSGNVGTSVVRALTQDPAVDQVVGVARRPPADGTLGAQWRAADVATDDLVSVLRGADAVVHLAWILQPSHDLAALQAVNVVGSSRVMDAVVEANVPCLVLSSSVGAYSASTSQELRDERWPTHGIPTSTYSRQKAYVERLLDRFELGNPDVRTVRMRPSLTFKADAARAVRKLFIGSLLPPGLFDLGRLPVLPDIEGLAFQVVHTDDVADAYRRAVTGQARGAFNLAGEPVLTLGALARHLGARTVPVPARLARLAAASSFQLHLQPSEPGWFDMAASAPLMDTARARRELGWTPEHASMETLAELLAAIPADRSMATAALG